VTGGNASNGEGEAKRHVGGVAVGSEANTSASEHFKGTQGGVSARFPCLPNAKGSLSFVDVTRPFNAEATVNLVATMSAIAAD
jgi:hypothetical protein